MIAQPDQVHNGGRIVFGPSDGYLYVGSGDGGHPTLKDVENRAQDPSTLLGKILRIDVESDASLTASRQTTHLSGSTVIATRYGRWVYAIRGGLPLIS